VSPSDTRAADPVRRGLGLSLLVIATAQLMVVLDDTIANIALPTLQNDLGISPALGERLPCWVALVPSVCNGSKADVGAPSQSA